MTNYKIEYQKYLKAHAADMRTTFLEYLCTKLIECKDKRNYKKAQYYEELIHEEEEQTQSEGIELNSYED